MNPRIDDLIVLAALGELTEQEAQELDQAVRADAVVAADLADALSSAATLQGAAAETPPSDLKTSVMDAIAGLAQEPPTVVENHATHPGDAGTTDTTDKAENEAQTQPRGLKPPPSPGVIPGVSPEAGPTSSVGGATSDKAGATVDSPGGQAPEVRSIGSARSLRRTAPWIAAAAAAIVIVVGAVVVLSDGGDADGHSAEIAAVMEADDAAAHSVAGDIGELEFVYSPSQEAFVLVADSLELPPENSTYQVWLVADGGQTSLGTFEPDDDGDMEMRADGIDPSGATIGITLEPKGGSEIPTEPMVAQSVV